MSRMRRMRSWAMLACGLAIGLALGGALSVGVWLGSARSPDDALPNLGELKLQAMASHGAETFAIATGPVDGDVEGLFTLDYLTGELQCFVINPRSGGLGGWFKTNIAANLTPEKGKKPSYLIATGAFNVKAGTYGNYKPAACICYIVDANTGEAAAYSFPWSQNAANVAATQATDMKLIYKWKCRMLDIGGELK